MVREVPGHARSPARVGVPPLARAVPRNTDHAAWEMQGGDSHKQGPSLPLGLTLEVYEELLDSAIIWTLPYKLFLTDRQRAPCFVDGSSKVNGQHRV